MLCQKLARNFLKFYVKVIFTFYLSIDTEFKTEWKNCSAHMLVKSLILGKHFKLEQREEYKIKKFEKIVSKNVIFQNFKK